MPYKLVLLAFVLTGCATAPRQCPPPEVITVSVTERVPVPSPLTASCKAECPPIVTNGDLLLCLQDTRRALADCDRRMSEVRALR